MTEEQARKIMSTVKEAVTVDTATFKTVSELFGSLGINQEQFESAFECIGKDLGFVLKRTRGNAAVVRYVQFSHDTDPEKYFRNILQLFLPYRLTEDLKPEGFQTFEQFYHNGQWLLDTVVHSVKTPVDVGKHLRKNLK
ncbi:hypothetical protein JOQ06_005774 [Pogonophryne albipinna]|uniref:Uncharacterized protein n=1 Tax=Pogonophryne albipinna TaxID=1090488 RepID=A0AAD6FPR2_9TELE|nr:hypothetical protein JOQ06_005774 [Pogonophryne albipinna]